MQRLMVLSLTVVLGASVVSGQSNVTAAAQSADKGNTIKPSNDLVVEGIPAIPGELAESVQKYTESIPVFMSNWHPTKREMLVAKRSGNTVQVHLVSAPLEKPKQLTSFPDPVRGGTFQRKTGDYFIFAKAPGGN